MIDSFGRLLRFDSAVQLEPLNEVISMQGTVEGGQLELLVRAGNQSFSHEVSLPPKALLSDALSPQTQLPGLHVGQTWTVPVYNPLWPTKSPIEIIYAKVEGTEPIFWNGAIEDAWLVVYRSDSGSGAGSRARTRGQALGPPRRHRAAAGGDAVRFDHHVRPSARQGSRETRRDGRPAVVDVRPTGRWAEDHD